MAQVTEYPWNGVHLEGGYPSTGSPNTFAFLENRNVRRVRVLLDPRQVMPVGGTTIPSAMQTVITSVADAAITTVAGQPTLTSKIEWAMLGCTEPTSATASRRPWVAWLENFWEKVDDLVGTHAATYGYAILSSPTVAELSQANGDTDGSMTAYKDVSWPANQHPATSAGPWLEVITAEVVEHLRGVGATTRIVCPLMYTDGTSYALQAGHPFGPWVDDEDTYYEAVLSPLGADAFQLRNPYSTYLATATAVDETYRSLWLESAYYTQPATPPNTVIDAIDLYPPDLVPFPPEVVDVLSQPVTNLVADPLNRGTSLTWTAPSDFGSGAFLYYEVLFGGLEWRTIDTAIEVGPVDNDEAYTVSVAVSTEVGISEAATTTVTPTESDPGPQNPFPAPYDAGDVSLPLTAPEPLTFAFPGARNFRPANWLKTPDEVEEGY